jgi:hypothetical protein
MLQKPSTLDEAIMLAQAYEQRTMPAPSSWSACRAVSQPPWSIGTTTRTSSAAVPTLSSTSVNQPTIKKFTPTEIDDHRIKGLCFKCDENFVPGIDTPANAYSASNCWMMRTMASSSPSLWPR